MINPVIIPTQIPQRNIPNSNIWINCQIEPLSGVSGNVRFDGCALTFLAKSRSSDENGSFNNHGFCNKYSFSLDERLI